MQQSGLGRQRYERCVYTRNPEPKATRTELEISQSRPKRDTNHHVTQAASVHGADSHGINAPLNAGMH